MAASGPGRVAPLVFFGRVMHARLRPKPNVFSYRVWYVRVPLSGLHLLRSPLLSLDRPGLFSLRTRDHGPRDGSPWLPWIRALLSEHGIHRADGEVWLQCFPRVLGYVFNPVSFWLCHDRHGALRAVLCEVNNTFGERHNYLLAHDDQRPIAPGDELRARKVFHVSPFCDVAGEYRFRFGVDPHATLLRIDHGDAAGRLLVTTLSGTGRPVSRAALLRAFFAYPLMTAVVIGRIHWQALRLWWKGVPFFSKPLPPVQETTR
jgi:DUF1365 family protein